MDKSDLDTSPVIDFWPRNEGDINTYMLQTAQAIAFLDNFEEICSKSKHLNINKKDKMDLFISRLGGDALMWLDSRFAGMDLNSVKNSKRVIEKFREDYCFVDMKLLIQFTVHTFNIIDVIPQTFSGMMDCMNKFHTDSAALLSEKLEKLEYQSNEQSLRILDITKENSKLKGKMKELIDNFTHLENQTKSMTQLNSKKITKLEEKISISNKNSLTNENITLELKDLQQRFEQSEKKSDENLQLMEELNSKVLGVSNILQGLEQQKTKYTELGYKDTDKKTSVNNNNNVECPSSLLIKKTPFESSPPPSTTAISTNDNLGKNNDQNHPAANPSGCSRCNGADHDALSCGTRYRSRCYVCGDFGHFARCCRWKDGGGPNLEGKAVVAELGGVGRSGSEEQRLYNKGGLGSGKVNNTYHPPFTSFRNRNTNFIT